jgi:dTDP-4-dehydrorhamnose reductase
MTKNIVIFGKNGQVANALIQKFSEITKFNIAVFNHHDCDFANLSNLKNFLNNCQQTFDIIINCVAYTNVDLAEDEKELCDKINHQAVKILADFCHERNIKLIHYSTDYVFDGSGIEPFAEDNTKNLHPLNYYGKSKLAGEIAIQKSGCDYLIIRLSWVYDNRKTSKNFVNTISRLAQNLEEIKIVNDQVGSPTDADYVAKNTVKIIHDILSPTCENAKNFHNRILHMNNGIFMSWYDFAKNIVDDLVKNNIAVKVKNILPIKSSEYQTKAMRPLNSRLKSNINFT